MIILQIYSVSSIENEGREGWPFYASFTMRNRIRKALIEEQIVETFLHNFIYIYFSYFFSSRDETIWDTKFFCEETVVIYICTAVSKTETNPKNYSFSILIRRIFSRSWRETKKKKVFTLMKKENKIKKKKAIFFNISLPLPKLTIIIIIIIFLLFD